MGKRLREGVREVHLRYNNGAVCRELLEASGLLLSQVQQDERACWSFPGVPYGGARSSLAGISGLLSSTWHKGGANKSCLCSENQAGATRLDTLLRQINTTQRGDNTPGYNAGTDIQFKPSDIKYLLRY